jgi:hypothetical protein
MLDIPPKAAKAFLRDLKLFFAETNGIKQDAIAARQRHLLLEHMPPRSKLRLDDVKELFHQMRADKKS